MSKYEASSDKEASRPHPDWQLSFSYYNRFKWPEHQLQWFEGIPTVATFSAKQNQVYSWPGGQQAVELVVTTILDFHEPHELFKKKAIKLSKAFNISIQEPEKRVYKPENRIDKKWESIETS